MITIVNALTFTTGSVLGILIGYLIEHNLARSRGIEAIRIVEFNKGAAEFRAAFVDYIYKLRHTKNMSDADQGWFDMRGIHTETVERDHEKAKIRFEPFIAKSDRMGFDAAWEKYRQWPEHFTKQDNKTDRKDMVLHHLYALLEYANPKG